MTSKYKLLITGRNTNYFLEKLIINNILIYDLNKNGKDIIIVVDEEGYSKIKKIKTSYKINVINRYGKVKYEYLLKKYFLFIICLLFGIFINILLSNMIFDVKVIHSNPRIRNIIYRDLEEYGIKKYHLKKNYRKKEYIITKILEKETNDIEWLEIESIGTKYVVRVEQRKKSKEKSSCHPRNIIAKKDAMILSINASKGEVSKKKLDYVKKGDVLISGLIHNKEEIVSKECAEGSVYGEVWYKVSLELPIKYHEEMLTGRNKSHFELEFLNRKYVLFNKYKTYRRKKYNIINSNLLPISLNYTNYLETREKNINYEIEKIDDIALNIGIDKLKSKIGRQDSILGKKVLKKQEKNSKIIVDVFFKVKEEITEEESIEDIDIEKENEKNSKE